MKTALVCGAGGFIGSHLVKKLKQEGYWVRGVDLKDPEYSKTEADEFICHDLRELDICQRVIRFRGERGNFYNDVPRQYEEPFDEIYQLAADMGGAGYVFTGENDANIMHNSAMINLNILDCVHKFNQEKNTNRTRIFYSSSACIYPEYNQEDPENPKTAEASAYPAQPDSDYGWEKLFSERLYLAFHRNYQIAIRIARLHNIFGPEGSWNDGREKAPAAFCRKVAEVPDGGTIDMWGDGLQTRSFLYIEECLVGIRRLMNSDFIHPINIGSDEMVTINRLVDLIAGIAGKEVSISHISGPLGVRGRTSDNQLIKNVLEWQPGYSLKKGLEKTYSWIEEQVRKGSD
jgi:nucleoside-diphosphate-sugar epimerase